MSRPKSITSHAPDQEPEHKVYRLSPAVAHEFGTRQSLLPALGIFAFIVIAVAIGTTLGDNFDFSLPSLALLAILVALVSLFNYIYLRSGRRTFYLHIQYRITKDGIAQEFPVGSSVPDGKRIVQRQARLREQYIPFAEIATIHVSERELTIRNGRGRWTGGAKEIMIPREIVGYQEIIATLGRRAETKFVQR